MSTSDQAVRIPTLDELLAERGLTQEAAGLLGGVDTATISRIRRGLVRPHPETVVRLARGLGISARRMAAIVDKSRLDQ